VWGSCTHRPRKGVACLKCPEHRIPSLRGDGCGVQQTLGGRGRRVLGAGLGTHGGVTGAAGAVSDEAGAGQRWGELWSRSRARRWSGGCRWVVEGDWCRAGSCGTVPQACCSRPPRAGPGHASQLDWTLVPHGSWALGVAGPRVLGTL